MATLTLRAIVLQYYYLLKQSGVTVLFLEQLDSQFVLPPDYVAVACKHIQGRVHLLETTALEQLHVPLLASSLHLSTKSHSTIPLCTQFLKTLVG